MWKDGTIDQETYLWHDQGKWVTCRKFHFYFLTPLYHNFKVLHFDANPITIGYIWLQSCEGFINNAKNNIKQRNLNTVFANISKKTSPTSDSFLLIMSHIETVILNFTFLLVQTASSYLIPLLFVFDFLVLFSSYFCLDLKMSYIADFSSMDQITSHMLRDLFYFFWLTFVAG